MVKKSELFECFVSGVEENKDHGSANVVDGLYAIASSLDSVASALRYLGNADAATPMGAIEALGLEVQNGFSSISSSINEVSRALEDLPINIKEGFTALASAVEAHE